LQSKDVNVVVCLDNCSTVGRLKSRFYDMNLLKSHFYLISNSHEITDSSIPGLVPLKIMFDKYQVYAR